MREKHYYFTETGTNAGKPHRQEQSRAGHSTAQHGGHGSEAVVQVQRPDGPRRHPVEAEGESSSTPNSSPLTAGCSAAATSTLLQSLFLLPLDSFQLLRLKLDAGSGRISRAEPCSPEFHFRHEMNWRSNRLPQIPRSSSSSLYAWLAFACFWFNLHTIHFDFFGGVRRPQVTSQVRLPSLLCLSSKQAQASKSGAVPSE